MIIKRNNNNNNNNINKKIIFIFLFGFRFRHTHRHVHRGLVFVQRLVAHQLHPGMHHSRLHTMQELHGHEDMRECEQTRRRRWRQESPPRLAQVGRIRQRIRAQLSPLPKLQTLCQHERVRPGRLGPGRRGRAPLLASCRRHTRHLLPLSRRSLHTPPANRRDQDALQMQRQQTPTHQHLPRQQQCEQWQRWWRWRLRIVTTPTSASSSAAAATATTQQ